MRWQRHVLFPAICLWLACATRRGYTQDGCADGWTVWDELREQPHLSEFASFLEDLDPLVGAWLNRTENATFTLVAPENDAFLRFRGDLNNRTKQQQLAYFLASVIPSEERLGDAARDRTVFFTLLTYALRNASSDNLTTSILTNFLENSGQVVVSGAQGSGFLVNNTKACNGLISTIDTVIEPSYDMVDEIVWAELNSTDFDDVLAIDNRQRGLELMSQQCGAGQLKTIWDFVSENNATKYAAAAVAATHMDIPLDDDATNMTYFVPTDAAVENWAKQRNATVELNSTSSFENQFAAHILAYPKNTTYFFGGPDKKYSGALASWVLNNLVLGNRSFGSFEPNKPMVTVLGHILLEETLSITVVIRSEDTVMGTTDGGIWTASWSRGIPACNGMVYLTDEVLLPGEYIATDYNVTNAGTVINQLLEDANLRRNNTQPNIRPRVSSPFPYSAPSPSPSPAIEIIEKEEDVPVVAIVVPIVIGSVMFILGALAFPYFYLERRKRRLHGGDAGGKGAADPEPASSLGSIQNDRELDAKAIKELFGVDTMESVAAEVNQHRSISLMTRLLMRESDEARNMRKEWEIDASEIEIVQTPDGKRKRLGSGGFGEVFQGIWNGTTPVAVKFISPNVSHEDHVKTLYKEISVLKDCRNNNVVQFFGACLQENEVMLVTEFMPLGDLFHALQGPKGFVCRWSNRGKFIALDVARGLVYLHSRRIVHCDLKSPNILLGTSLNAKLADLGMSRFLMKESVTKSASVGTWSWAAPELLLNSRINEQVDIYSFGVMLWEICTGLVPQRGTMRDLRVPEECPQEVADLYERCVEPEPYDRPSAKEVAQEIVRIIRMERDGSVVLSSISGMGDVKEEGKVTAAAQMSVTLPTKGTSFRNNPFTAALHGIRAASSKRIIAGASSMNLDSPFELEVIEDIEPDLSGASGERRGAVFAGPALAEKAEDSGVGMAAPITDAAEKPSSLKSSNQHLGAVRMSDSAESSSFRSPSMASNGSPTEHSGSTASVHESQAAAITHDAGGTGSAAIGAGPTNSRGTTAGTAGHIGGGAAPAQHPTGTAVVGDPLGVEQQHSEVGILSGDTKQTSEQGVSSGVQTSDNASQVSVGGQVEGSTASASKLIDTQDERASKIMHGESRSARSQDDLTCRNGSADGASVASEPAVYTSLNGRRVLPALSIRRSSEADVDAAEEQDTVSLTMLQEGMPRPGARGTDEDIAQSVAARLARNVKSSRKEKKKRLKARSLPLIPVSSQDMSDNDSE